MYNFDADDYEMWRHLLPPERAFSDDFMQSLFERYKIEPIDQKMVQDALDVAVHQWRQWRERSQLRQAHRIELDTVKDQANALRSTLTAIPDETWKEWMATDNNLRINDPYNPEWFDEPYLKYSAPIVYDMLLTEELHFVIPPSDELDANTKITLAQLLKVLRLLSRVASPATPYTSQPKRGTKVDTALRQWTFEMLRLWEWKLKRKFTRDVGPNGEPISEAACFCVEVYQEMHPRQPKSRVLNEMKIAIKTKRELLEQFSANR